MAVRTAQARARPGARSGAGDLRPRCVPEHLVHRDLHRPPWIGVRDHRRHLQRIDARAHLLQRHARAPRRRRRAQPDPAAGRAGAGDAALAPPGDRRGHPPRGHGRGGAVPDHPRARSWGRCAPWSGRSSTCWTARCPRPSGVRSAWSGPTSGSCPGHDHHPAGRGARGGGPDQGPGAARAGLPRLPHQLRHGAGLRRGAGPGRGVARRAPRDRSARARPRRTLG